MQPGPARFSQIWAWPVPTQGPSPVPSRSGCGDESKEVVDPVGRQRRRSCLTRSFYPRKINRAKVESSPGIVSQAASMLVAGRPARSLHTIVRGVGAGGSTYGAVVAGALTGGVGILIFKKRPDDDDGDVTMEDVKDVDNKPRQEDIKKDMGKHQMDVDMEAKFHKWMELMGREYSNQEEKAYRFELFKERMKKIDFH
ncbi:hypothetical protein PVAP13_9NG076505 [Panicum virgatum]|uniref:Cathepsin propeptide inhibitor domain-containing protein n=1 Tax=Panicum virgatum TaxID=38727 RepID=A0A8T0MEJ0_PANVG|nr:hypothetical protein PVAP13_9NG076505 [Panicum virgatum]